MAEWRSDRGGLARRVSQVRAIPAFPSVLIFSSSTCVRIPHLYRAYISINCLIFSTLWDSATAFGAEVQHACMMLVGVSDGRGVVQSCMS